MAIVKCKECDKEVSSEAEVCPHCGIRVKPRWWEPVELSDEEKKKAESLRDKFCKDFKEATDRRGHMAIVKCKECDKEVSSEAEVCPHCEVRVKPRWWEPIITLCLLGGFLGGCVGLCQLRRAAVEKEERANEMANEIREAKTRKECEKNPKCKTQKKLSEIEFSCQQAIQEMAKYEHKWGWLNQFPVHGHYTQGGPGAYLMAGDNIEFQNGLGLYIKHSYECIYVPNKGVTVKVWPGRLNKGRYSASEL